jgi:prenyltransferase beta subunit
MKRGSDGINEGTILVGSEGRILNTDDVCLLFWLEHSLFLVQERECVYYSLCTL